MSVDGGNIRVRIPVGKPCDWKGYKAVRLHNQEAFAASFQENNLITVELKSLAHNEKLKMYLKSLPIVALI